MWLVYYVDIIFWTTVRLVIDWCCSLCTSYLFYIIETIITPNITTEGFLTIMFWFLTIPILIMNLLLHFLPSFHNYQRIRPSRSGKGCSSGRSGRKGRHGDRHHSWWSLPYRKKGSSPKRKHQHQHQSFRQKINALHYFDPLPIPSTIAVSDDDIFYDVRDVYYLTLKAPWLPDPDPKPAITTETINMLVDSIDVLAHYNQLAFFDSISFCNSRYRRLDPSSKQYSTKSEEVFQEAMIHHSTKVF